jgi:phosphoserine phosphatase
MNLEFKVWLEGDSKGLITFDFDSTLTKPQWSDEDEMWNEADPTKKGVEHSENHKLMNKYASEGYTIWIVTSRRQQNVKEVWDFVKNHKLPVSNVIATNGEEKGPILANLNALIHHDDMPKDTEDSKKAFNEKIYNLPLVLY